MRNAGKEYPIILVTVQENINNPITPTQVSLVEQLIKRELGRQFKLVFRVSQLREVVADYEQPLSTPDLFGPVTPPPVSPLPQQESIPSSSDKRESERDGGQY